MPILENGHFKRTRNSIIAKNTTQFDAVFHILFSIMAEEETAKDSFFELANLDVRSFVENYFKRGAVQQTYLARNKVLQQIIDCEIVDKMKVLDCSNLTAKYVIEHIISPIWPSLIKKETCKCGTNREKIAFLDIASGLFNKENLFELMPSPQNCEICFERKTIVQDANNIVFIDLIQTNRSEPISFEKLPNVISIKHNIFCLIALVAQVPLCDGTDHFVAHIKRGNSWYIFDNNSKAVTKSKIEKKRFCHTC